ncbi:MAG: histidine phosphatase family protein [Acidimicrobiia bacterium]
MADLFVVRHAHAGSRRDWPGEDALRPLDPRGARQAERLAEVLADRGIRRLVSSPAVRCVETLRPLGKALDLDVEVDGRLAEGGAVADVLALVAELAGKTAAVCSHGDVIPDLLDALAERGVELPARRKWQKASTWVLRGGRSGPRSGTYVPPPR